VFNNPVSYVDPTGLSWWDKVKSFGRGLWNGFTGFFHEAIFVPMDFLGTGIDIFLGTGYKTRSYLGRAFEEKLRAGQLDDWRDMYESLFLNVVLGGIPDLYVSLEDAYWGNWEPLGEWLGSAGAGALVFWGSCKLLQKKAVPTQSVPKWPSTPGEMDRFLGIEGKRIPDGPTTPGRNKVVWQPSDRIKITYEQHPYDIPRGAPPEHTGPHWHLDYPGHKHIRFLPGEPIPGYDP
jgi:hypothetical protein